MKIKVIVISLLVLAGCSKPVHDVAYYKSHEKERQAMLEACANNPGGTQDDPNCINATMAQFQSGTLKAGPSKSY